MKDLNRIDSEISRKNYENELVLCNKQAAILKDIAVFLLMYYS